MLWVIKKMTVKNNKLGVFKLLLTIGANDILLLNSWSDLKQSHFHVCFPCDNKKFNPFVPTVPTFAVRETASLSIMGAPWVPPLCRETQSLGQQMLNAPVGINGLNIRGVSHWTIYKNSPLWPRKCNQYKEKYRFFKKILSSKI